MQVLGNISRAVAACVKRAATATARLAKVAGKWLAKVARKVAAQAKVWTRLAVAKIRAVAAHMRDTSSSQAQVGGRSMAMSGAQGGTRGTERPPGGSSRQSGGMVCPNGHRVAAQQVPCRCGGHSRYRCRMRIGVVGCGWSAVIPPMAKDCDG